MLFLIFELCNAEKTNFDDDDYDYDGNDDDDGDDDDDVKRAMVDNMPGFY